MRFKWFGLFCLLLLSEMNILNNSQVLRKLPLNHTSFSTMSWWWCVKCTLVSQQIDEIFDENWWNYRSEMSSVFSHQRFGARSIKFIETNDFKNMSHISWIDLWCLHSLNLGGLSNFKCFRMRMLSRWLNATGSFSQLLVIDPIDKSKINKVTWNN